MRRSLLSCLFLYMLFSCTLTGESFQVEGIDFHYRLPERHSGNSQIMVLFGGRNWPGDKTLKSYGFHALADKHQLILLSPSFRDRNYWEPEKWSGKCLMEAVSRLERRYGLKPQKLLFYGYSAGGQCSTLFSQWIPDRVAAWGVHACGVYPETIKSASAPALITCGTEDAERFCISRHFIYRYREQGGQLLWKYYPDAGHELSQQALEMARTWFDDILSGKKIIAYGEDDTHQISDKIEPEFRNPLYSAELMELWRE